MKERYIVHVVPEVGGDVADTLCNVENCTTRRNHRQPRGVWLQLLKEIKLLDDTKRQTKTRTVLPSADTMLFWAPLASGQITMRKVAGWQGLAEPPSDQPIDLAA